MSLHSLSILTYIVIPCLVVSSREFDQSANEIQAMNAMLEEQMLRLKTIALSTTA
jgi:hypothetical protein